MKCLKVTFAELHEEKGAFGKESISPGGAEFPKHMILSYDLKTKTVVFPEGWKCIYEGGKVGEKLHTGFVFLFDNCWESGVRKDKVKKISSFEVDYDPKEFVPDKNLRLVKIDVPLKHKSYMDKLIKKYLATKLIVAQRSRKSARIRTVDGKRVTFPTYSYELIEQLVGNGNEIWEELGKEEKNAGKKTYMILSENPGVFLGQLANFNK